MSCIYGIPDRTEWVMKAWFDSYTSYEHHLQHSSLDSLTDSRTFYFCIKYNFENYFIPHNDLKLGVSVLEIKIANSPHIA